MHLGRTGIQKIVNFFLTVQYPTDTVKLAGQCKGI